MVKLSRAPKGASSPTPGKAAMPDASSVDVERPMSEVMIDASNATRVIVQRVPIASEPKSGFPVATFRI
jgi:hypothetical protein